MGGIAPSIGGRGGYAADPLAVGIGYKNWSFPFFATSTSDTIDTGTLFGELIWLPAGTTITNVVLNVNTAGVGTAPTHFWVGIADKTGKMLAQSADLRASASLTAGTGPQVFPLAAPLTVVADDVYYVVFLQVGAFGTTAIRLQCGAELSNQGVAQGSGVPPIVAIGGQANLPANGSSFALTVGTRPYPVAVT